MKLLISEIFIRFSYIHIITLLLTLASAESSSASNFVPTTHDTLIVSRNLDLTYVGKQCWFLEDANNEFSINDILSAKRDKEFQRSIVDVPSFQATASAFWIRFHVKNISSPDTYIQVGSAFMDSIDVYEVLPNGKIHSRHTGDHLPFSEREVQTSRFLFQLPPRGDTISTYYLRIESTQPLFFPLQVGSLRSINEDTHLVDFIQGSYFGFMLLIILYNLFIFFSIRDKIYLIYVGYAISISFFMGFVFGYFFEFFWPNTPVINQYAVISSAFTIIFAVLFTRDFLTTKYQTPKLDKGLLAFIGIGAIIILLNLAGIAIPALMLSQASLLLMAVYFLIIGIILYRQGFKPAKYYLLAWSSLIIGIIAAILESLSFFYISAYINPIQLGSSVEVALLSFALADKINDYKQSLFEAQEEILLATVENKKIIEEQNIILEQRVVKRTEELTESNEELNQTNDELKATIDLVSEQREMLHKVNKNITASIRYAQRIQNSILPPLGVIKNMFTDAFVLYKPRDIVAGDFYFCTQEKDRIYFAVADCTGHGVPGAFMSMIGSRLLYESIVGLQMQDPAEVLRHMNKSVVRTLRQYETRTHDGMDIGLLVFDRKTKKIEFSGAHHNLIYLTKTEGKITSVRGSRNGIGGEMRRIKHSYKTEILDIDENEEIMFYLFSDGFPDQMGGMHQRKYMIKHLREKFASIWQMSGKEQHKILDKELELWKGEIKQADDILIAGLRWKF